MSSSTPRSEEFYSNIYLFCLEYFISHKKIATRKVGTREKLAVLIVVEVARSVSVCPSLELIDPPLCCPIHLFFCYFLPFILSHMFNLNSLRLTRCCLTTFRIKIMLKVALKVGSTENITKFTSHCVLLMFKAFLEILKLCTNSIP